jgi:hypothetical protein
MSFYLFPHSTAQHLCDSLHFLLYSHQIFFFSKNKKLTTIREPLFFLKKFLLELTHLAETWTHPTPSIHFQTGASSPITNPPPTKALKRNTSHGYFKKKTSHGTSH